MAARGTLQLGKSGQTRLAGEATEWQESTASCRECQRKPNQMTAWRELSDAMQSAPMTALKLLLHL